MDSRRLHLPMHICPAAERLDIVTVNEMTKTVYPIELTVCFDEKSMQMKKQAEYHYPREVALLKVADHQCHLWTVQVGLREIIDELSFSAPAGPMQQHYKTIYFQLVRTFLHESFTV